MTSNLPVFNPSQTPTDLALPVTGGEATNAYGLNSTASTSNLMGRAATLDFMPLFNEITKLSGKNTIYAGEGNNIITTGAGKDWISTGSGQDIIDAGDGKNTILAGEGVNLISSGKGDDLINSGAAGDFINAGDGRNTILAGEGDNCILSGKGDDLIYGGAGNDAIYSGAGNDIIYAGNGNNVINAGTGNDTVYLGSGTDKIILEAGKGSVTLNRFDVKLDKLRLGESLLGKSLNFTTQGQDTLVKAGKDLLATIKGAKNGNQSLLENRPLYRYQATDLGNPATTVQNVTVSAINDFGQISGRYTRDGLFEYTNPTTGQAASRTVVQPFVWENGQITELNRTGVKIGDSDFGAPNGSTVELFGGGGFINGANDRGVIVGAADEVPGRGTDRGTYWQTNGTNNELSIYDFGGIESYFFDINNQNQAAGRHIYGPGSTTTAPNRSRAIAFANGEFSYLPDLGGDTGTARGINRQGDIVGFIDGDRSLNDATVNTAVLWKKNAQGNYELTNLGTFGYDQSELRDINSSGQMIGSVSNGAGATLTSTPFILRNDQFTALGSLGGNTGTTNGINEFGQVVGASQIASGANRAFLWSGGVMTDLNNLLATPLTVNGAAVTLTNATNINNFGDITVTGTYTYQNAEGNSVTGTRSFVLKAVV